ncbi:MAG TPA: DUF3347 domain-containing protein [Chitinophagaceae bacterium]|nr:DUF3347 domain-containing protein [Chitinophagaceae bacterium]
MKNIIFGITVTLMIALMACNSNTTTSNTEKSGPQKDSNAAMTQMDQSSITNTRSAIKSVAIKHIIVAYLQLKNAFANDNSGDAATAGKSLLAAITNFDTKILSAEQAKIFNDIADDAKEHSEHIGANSGNIKHQREHFVMLSKDIADFTKTFGNGGQTLYKDFCPMANDGKGAIWISEIKKIKNPYLGKAMPTCGTVKEEIK